MTCRAGSRADHLDCVSLSSKNHQVNTWPAHSTPVGGDTADIDVSQCFTHTCWRCVRMEVQMHACAFMFRGVCVCACVHAHFIPCFPCRLIEDEVSTCALKTSGSESHTGTVPCYHLRAEEGKNALCIPLFFFILLSCLSLRKQNRLSSLLVPCGEIWSTQVQEYVRDAFSSTKRYSVCFSVPLKKAGFARFHTGEVFLYALVWK